MLCNRPEECSSLLILQGINGNRKSVMFQDNVLAYTENFSMIALELILSEWMISHILWPGRSPDLNPYDYIQLGRKWEGVCAQKVIVYVNIPLPIF